MSATNSNQPASQVGGSLTHYVVDWALGLTYDDIPERVREQAI